MASRSRIRVIGSLLGTAVVCLVAGCSSVPTTPEAGRPTQGQAQRHEAPRLSREGDSGFTVTEVVRIDSDVRRDYQRALSLLQTGQPDEGIALLESVVD